MADKKSLSDLAELTKEEAPAPAAEASVEEAATPARAAPPPVEQAPLVARGSRLCPLDRGHPRAGPAARAPVAR